MISRPSMMALASAMVFSPRSMTGEDEEELEEGLELEELEEALLEEDWLLELDPLLLLEEADELCSLEEVASLEEEGWAEEDSLEDELCSEEVEDDSLLDALLEASEEETLEDTAGSPPQEARANPNKANRRVFFFIAPNHTPNGPCPRKREGKAFLKKEKAIKICLMSLYLLRHGQTDWNKDGIIQGRYDTSLNETGKKQAEEAGVLLKDIPLSRCYVSPLYRARQTAEIALKGKDIPLLEENRLVEMAYGIYEGTDWKAEGYQKTRKNLAMRYPGGESYLDVAHRVFSFLDELKDIASKEDVLIVCHRGVARMVHAYFVDDVDNDTFIDRACPNGGVMKYDYPVRNIPIKMDLPK